MTHTQRSANTFEVLGLLGPKPCKNCESRMSEANPRQSLVKGERLIRYELASAIVEEETMKLKWILGCGRRSGRASLTSEQRVQRPLKGRVQKPPLEQTEERSFIRNIKIWLAVSLTLLSMISSKNFRTTSPLKLHKTKHNASADPSARGHCSEKTRWESNPNEAMNFNKNYARKIKIARGKLKWRAEN